MAAIVEGLTLFVRGIIHSGKLTMNFLSASFQLNYNIVSKIVRSSAEAINSTRILIVSLCNACIDVSYYIMEFIFELMNFSGASIRLFGKFVGMCWNIIVLTSAGIGVVLNVLWQLLLGTLQISWLSILTIAEFLADLLLTLLKMIPKSVLHINQGVSSISNLTTTAFTDTMSDIIHGLNYMHHWTFTTVNEQYSRTVNHLSQGANTAYREITTNVPIEAYGALLLIPVMCISVKVLIGYLHEHGYTFPNINTQHTEQVQWNPNEHNDVESSDDDVDDNDSTTSDSASDLITIASSSESSDEDDVLPINVQLPHPQRHRLTATPLPTGGKDPNDVERQLENERDKRLCVVCQDNVKNVLIMPCKHMCLCVTCAHAIVSSRLVNRRICPLCRVQIREVMDVYV
ncbi:unnamed protein product [Owenia fusiformis]|uniref:Uncharacterized protein n=1 Tax=Owenia fusiformis TaxID=6347 RepID=A0A8J1UDS7_OWEFU|nr:unnamed protein product [Owenia fusiformis]